MFVNADCSTERLQFSSYWHTWRLYIDIFDRKCPAINLRQNSRRLTYVLRSVRLNQYEVQFIYEQRVDENEEIKKIDTHMQELQENAIKTRTAAWDAREEADNLTKIIIEKE